MTLVTGPPSRDLVFVSYSHRDKPWMDRLRVLLKPFEREGTLRVWADPYIEVGEQWRRSIDDALRRMRAAVLLVGPEFLASDFIVDVEIPAVACCGSRARRSGEPC